MTTATFTPSTPKVSTPNADTAPELSATERHRTEVSIRRKTLFDTLSAAHLASHTMKEIGVSQGLKARLNNLIRAHDAMVREFEVYIRKMAKKEAPNLDSDQVKSIADQIIDSMHTNGALIYEIARWCSMFQPAEIEAFSHRVEAVAAQVMEEGMENRQPQLLKGWTQKGGTFTLDADPSIKLHRVVTDANVIYILMCDDSVMGYYDLMKPAIDAATAMLQAG